MKVIKNLLIIFTLLMIIIFGVLFYSYKSVVLTADSIATYSEDEMETYKKVWSHVNESFNQGQETLFKYMIIFWVTMLLLGYLIILLIYLFQIKPVKELDKFAAEISRGNLDTPLPMHRNNVFGTFTESFDLMREELKASKEREIAAEQAKRELVAGLSHDIKTPISTIQATCEVASMKYSDDADISEKIGIISAKTETINLLINNLLHSTMEELEELEINAEENSSEMIEEYFSGQRQSVKINFVNHIPPCLVYLDPLRMEQAVDNVIGNSIKYAGTDIEVSFSEIEGPNNTDGKPVNYIKIKIKDFGPGVPEEDLAMITEKYFRGSNTKDVQGYGLGMNLVKTYMEGMGGGIEYYNEDGFVVELLVKKV